MLGEVLIIALLLVINAFFAMSEMAIVSARKPILKQFAQKGRKSAILALDLAENSGRFLSTVQVGITLVGILAGAYGGATIAEKLSVILDNHPFIAPYGETVAVLIVVGAITYFSVVVGELVPKQLALGNAEKIAMIVARPMIILSRLCTPVVALLETSARILGKLLRIKPRDEGVTEDEFNAILADGVTQGIIEQEEQDVIRRVIRLGDRDVKSIMTHRREIDFVDVGDTKEMVLKKIRESQHSRYPVTDGSTSNVIGMVKVKKIIAAMDQSDQFDVRDHVLDLMMLDEKCKCLEALNLFRTRSIHIAGVVDEYGTFEGIFTTSDLLEAIVGVIPSNYDAGDTQLITLRQDGSWLVDGLTPIDELLLTKDLEDIPVSGDYQTLAGFILKHMTGRPIAGTVVDVGTYTFEIVDMDGYRIDKVLIQKKY